MYDFEIQINLYPIPKLKKSKSLVLLLKQTLQVFKISGA